MKPNFGVTTKGWNLWGALLLIIVALGLPLTGLAQGTGTAAPAAVEPSFGKRVSTNIYALPETGWGVVANKPLGVNLGRRANGDFVGGSYAGAGVGILTPQGQWSRQLALPQAGDTVINGTLVSDNGEWATAVVGRPGSRNFAVAWDLTVTDDANGKVPVKAVLTNAQPRGVKIVKGQPCVFGNSGEEGFLWNLLTGEVERTQGGSYMHILDVNPESQWVGVTDQPLTPARGKGGGSFSNLPTLGPSASVNQISRSGKRVAGVSGTLQVPLAVTWEDGSPKVLTLPDGTSPRGEPVGVTETLVVGGKASNIGFVHDSDLGYALSLPEYLTKYGIPTVAGERIVGFVVDDEDRRFLLTNKRIIQIGVEPVGVVPEPTNIEFTGDGVSVTWKGNGVLEYSTNLVEWSPVPLSEVSTSGGTSTHRIKALERSPLFFRLR